jgi:curved DNA-binding protein CbpA
VWELEREIISQGYRQLSKKMHPDKGGTAAEMISLNAARDMLKALVYAAMDAPAGQPVRFQDHQPATTRPPQPRASVTPADFVQYVRQQMQRDPLTAGVLTILENFVAEKAKPRTGAAAKSRRRR